MFRHFVAAALCATLSSCAGDPAFAETCTASWYGGAHHGRLTASGKRFNENTMSAAHRTRPFGSHATVSHGGSSVVVTINDRGPFVRGRCIDLSRAAARALGIGGVGKVEVRFKQKPRA